MGLPAVSSFAVTIPIVAAQYLQQDRSIFQYTKEAKQAI